MYYIIAMKNDRMERKSRLGIENILRKIHRNQKMNSEELVIFQDEKNV